MTPSPKGWTLDTYAAHSDAMRACEEKFQAERDRRYTEVKAAKEQAEHVALVLARQIQTYKDEQANELREQINRERGLYASHVDLTALAEKFTVMHQPMLEFMASQRGRVGGAGDNRTIIAWVVALLVSLIAIGSFVFDQRAPATAQPQIIYVPAPPGTLMPSPQQQPK